MTVETRSTRPNWRPAPGSADKEKKKNPVSMTAVFAGLRGCKMREGEASPISMSTMACGSRGCEPDPEDVPTSEGSVAEEGLVSEGFLRDLRLEKVEPASEEGEMGKPPTARADCRTQRSR